VLRVGLLGLGDAGRHHARALIAAGSLGELVWTAVGTRDPSKLVARRGELAPSAAIVTTDELIAGDLCDAMIIATPDGLHAEQAQRALAAGHHVLVEKPLATAVEAAGAVVAAARAADRVLQVGYHLRHHAGHGLLHARRAELVGEVRSIAVRWAWPDPAVDGWRANGTSARWWSLAALGTHGIDLALWLAGAAVTEIVAIREPAHGVDRAAEVSLRFATGALAHVSVAVTHRCRPSLVIAGERGEVEAIGTLGASGAGELLHRVGREASTLPFTPEDPYLRQLRAFVARCGGAPPQHDPHALDNVVLLDRITAP
jgi:predicted dehydrogenase